MGKRNWAWNAPEAVKELGHLWSTWFAPRGCSLVLVGVNVSGSESTGHSHHAPDNYQAGRAGGVSLEKGGLQRDLEAVSVLKESQRELERDLGHGLE